MARWAKEAMSAETSLVDAGGRAAGEWCAELGAVEGAGGLGAGLSLGADEGPAGGRGKYFSRN